MTRSKYFWLLLFAAGIGTFPLFVRGQNEPVNNRLNAASDTGYRETPAGDGSGVTRRTMRISFYCSCGICCDGYAAVKVETGQRRTASGYRLKPDGSDAMHIAAAGPDIRFGTKIQIPNLGTVVVRDRGGAIQGNRLDIYTGHDPGAHQRAKEFGVIYEEVTIISE